MNEYLQYIDLPSLLKERDIYEKVIPPTRVMAQYNIRHYFLFILIFKRLYLINMLYVTDFTQNQDNGMFLFISKDNKYVCTIISNVNDNKNQVFFL